MDRDAAAEVRCSWLTDPDRVPGVSKLFLASVHPFYPSHGDLMYGRADAPGVWAEDFEQVHLLELSEAEFSDGPFSSPGLRVAIAEAGDVLAGLALVAVVEFDAGRPEPVRYARLDDIVVRPDMRGRGFGTALTRWVEGALRDSGVPRIFIESGRENVAAHRFFERHGFSRISISLMKDLWGLPLPPSPRGSQATFLCRSAAASGVPVRRMFAPSEGLDTVFYTIDVG